MGSNTLTLPPRLLMAVLLSWFTTGVLTLCRFANTFNKEEPLLLAVGVKLGERTLLPRTIDRDLALWIGVATVT